MNGSRDIRNDVFIGHAANMDDQFLHQLVHCLAMGAMIVNHQAHTMLVADELAHPPSYKPLESVIKIDSRPPANHKSVMPQCLVPLLNTTEYSSMDYLSNRGYGPLKEDNPDEQA